MHATRPALVGDVETIGECWNSAGSVAHELLVLDKASL